MGSEFVLSLNSKHILERGWGQFVLRLNSNHILEQGMGSEFVFSLNNKHQYLILVIIKNIEIQSDLPWV